MCEISQEEGASIHLSTRHAGKCSTAQLSATPGVNLSSCFIISQGIQVFSKNEKKKIVFIVYFRWLVEENARCVHCISWTDTAVARTTTPASLVCTIHSSVMDWFHLNQRCEAAHIDIVNSMRLILLNVLFTTIMCKINILGFYWSYQNWCTFEICFVVPQPHHDSGKHVQHLDWLDFGVISTTIDFVILSVA